MSKKYDELKKKYDELKRWSIALDSCVDIQAEFIDKHGLRHEYTQYCNMRPTDKSVMDRMFPKKDEKLV